FHATSRLVADLARPGLELRGDVEEAPAFAAFHLHAVGGGVDGGVAVRAAPLGAGGFRADLELFSLERGRNRPLHCTFGTGADGLLPVFVDGGNLDLALTGFLHALLVALFLVLGRDRVADLLLFRNA